MSVITDGWKKWSMNAEKEKKYFAVIR